jgi:Flp pilus assembly protein CpaB
VLLALAGLGLLAAGAWQPSRAAVAPTANQPAVITTRFLDAGARVQPGDVSVIQLPWSPDLHGVARAIADAAGRRTRVALPEGSLLLRAVLNGDPPLTPGRRRVELHLDGSALPSGLEPADIVDVLAAIPDAQAVGRLARVASGAVVFISAQDVTLDVDAAEASRLLWAEAFSKSLRLLARPPGDLSAVPDVAGVGST